MNLKKYINIYICIKNYALILIASSIYALAISLFFTPNNIAPGGLSGISIMINHICGYSIGGVYFILNIPIIILGIYNFGFKFIVKTFFSILCCAVFTDIFTIFLHPATRNTLLASIIGGALIAVSIGIIFRQGGTTGGTDIVIKIIKKKYKHMKTGNIFLILDFTIVFISIFVFREIESGLLGAISVYTSAKVIDWVLYGGEQAKLSFIISYQNEQICDIILKQLKVGATIIEAKGAYNKQNITLIMCVTRDDKIPKIKEVVRQQDTQAFMIVTSANTVFGTGFKNYDAEDI